MITLLRAAGHTVEERRLTIDELVAAHRTGLLRECFGTGTAATLSHIQRILHGGDDLTLPPVESRLVGPAVRARLVELMTGLAHDPYGWLEPVN